MDLVFFGEAFGDLIDRARAAVAGIAEVCSPKFEVLGAGEVDLIVTDAGVERL